VHSSRPTAICSPPRTDLAYRIPRPRLPLASSSQGGGAKILSSRAAQYSSPQIVSFLKSPYSSKSGLTLFMKGVE